MASLIWSEDYSVGVDKFDFHHKKLFSIINSLRKISSNEKSDEIVKILDELLDYSNYHLKKEEEFFDNFGYSEAEAHKKKHQFYNQKLKEFIDSKETFDVNQVLDFLEKWWMNHILQEDKKYSNFFSNKSI